MRSRSGERGSVTAEFAIALPAVVIVLACCLSGLQLVAQQVRLQDAAAVAARLVARDDAAAAVAVAQRLVPGVQVSRWAQSDLECVGLAAASVAPAGTLLGITLKASSCSLAGGR